MRLASFVQGNRPGWGIVEGETIRALHDVDPDYATLRDAIAGSAIVPIVERAVDAPRLDANGICWAPVIPNPDKILCVGINYENHRRETMRGEVAHPTIFARLTSSQTGHQCPIERPRVSTRVDYEGELAVIIGRAGRYIDRRDALAHVAGYSIYDDVSIRDFQHHTHQFTPGKNFPGTGAFGPWMVTPDAFGEIGPQALQTRVNNEVVQSATLDEMIFSVPTIIEYCSSFTRLLPGDVIITGTPGGVGAKRTPPRWLIPGDIVDVSIEGIGTLSNSITVEKLEGSGDVVV